MIWDFLEKPWTSAAAQVYAMSSLGVILVSTVTFIVFTFEELQVDKDGNQAYPDVSFPLKFWTSSLLSFSQLSTSPESSVVLSNGSSS